MGADGEMGSSDGRVSLGWESFFVRKVNFNTSVGTNWDVTDREVTVISDKLTFVKCYLQHLLVSW